MKVFMTGGTGFVGTNLTRRLTDLGHEVSILTRKSRDDIPVPNGASTIQGDPTQKGSWQDTLGDHDVVINLAGASIFRRWSGTAKKTIRDSRLRTTRNLVAGLSNQKGRNTLLLNTSAVGYYGFRGDEELDENSPPGNDFLASLCCDWEAEALKAQESEVNVVICRFGIVMGKDGGTLSELVPLFKKGLGAPLGSGEQWISWIHERDLADIYQFLIERKDVSGPINCTAPNAVRNKEMTKTLGEVLDKPTFLPAVPAFMVKLRLGEFGSVVLNGQKVLPKRLLDMGFTFHFPDLKCALEDLLKSPQ